MDTRQEQLMRMITDAAQTGDVEMIRQLLHEVRLPLSYGPLFMAAGGNHTECMEVLLPVSELDASTLRPIISICLKNQNIQAIYLLLPYFEHDPDMINSAVLMASYCKNAETFDLLYPLCNPRVALETALSKQRQTTDPEMWLLCDRMQQERLRETLAPLIESAPLSGRHKI